MMAAADGRTDRRGGGAADLAVTGMAERGDLGGLMLVCPV